MSVFRHLQQQQQQQQQQNAEAQLFNMQKDKNDKFVFISLQNHLISGWCKIGKGRHVMALSVLVLRGQAAFWCARHTVK